MDNGGNLFRGQTKKDTLQEFPPCHRSELVWPIGGVLALLVTGTNFSVSSGVGFRALFGVSVQTGVIMLEYINQLPRYSIEDAVVEGAVLRLRPIMMTMLVATLGLLPAALSHAIGSDSQRPFAIVIVGGLMPRW